MSLFKKIITCYTLTTLLISSFSYTVKLHGAEGCSRIKRGAVTLPGSGKATEDRYSVESLDGLLFCGVYDGHTSANAAEFVKNNLCKIFFKQKIKQLRQD